MSTTLAYDATTGNVGALPRGLHVGYTTGPGVAWTPSQYIADPLAVRICQDPAASDETADVLDVEAMAATIGDIDRWVINARKNFAANVRPGQRWPMIYCSGSTLDPAVSVLTAARLVNVPFFIAKPGLPLATAIAQITSAAGPYPLQGVQYAWHSTYDSDVFLSSWLTTQSGVPGSTIRVANSGPAVQAAQDRLNAWHTPGRYATVAVDGAFGQATLMAVRAFQAFAKLPVDGVAGPATWAALNKPVGPPPPPPPPVPVYGPPLSLAETESLSRSVTLNWRPPAPVKGLPAAPEYHVFVYKGSAVASNLVNGKPFLVTGATTMQVSLTKGQEYVVHVAACDLKGGSAKPGVFASLSFTVA